MVSRLSASRCKAAPWMINRDPLSKEFLTTMEAQCRPSTAVSSHLSMRNLGTSSGAKPSSPCRQAAKSAWRTTTTSKITTYRIKSCPWVCLESKKRFSTKRASKKETKSTNKNLTNMSRISMAKKRLYKWRSRKRTTLPISSQKNNKKTSRQPPLSKSSS